MRRIELLGIALIVAGAVVFLSASGAFDSATADRGISIDVAEDENAIVGLEYENVTLEDPEAETCYGTFLGECAIGVNHYKGVQLILITDQSMDDLSLNEVSFEQEGDDIINETSSEQIDDGVWAATGDFDCDFYPFVGEEDASTVLTISLAVGSDDVEVSLERNVEVQCTQ